MDFSNKTKEELLIELETLQAKHDALVVAQNKSADSNFNRIFNIFPIPISECDFSEVKTYFNSLNNEGVTDIANFLKHNPNKRALVIKLAKMVKLVAINSAHYSLHGVSVEDYQSVIDNVYGSFSDENIEEYINQYIALSKGDTLYMQEMTPFTTVQGNLKYVISYLQVDPKHAHDLSKVYVVYIEITEQKLAEQEIIKTKNKLAELNQDKDRFISILAHDLRSPFSSILGLLELVLSEIHTSNINVLEKRLNIISNAAKNAFNLLEDILLWTRSQSGKLPFEPENLNLTSQIINVVKLAKSRAYKKDIKISVQGKKSTEVFADANMIKTVLRNLLSNAIKFTHKQGEITITTTQNHHFVNIEVSDNGIGMSEDTIQHILNGSSDYSSNGTEQEKGSGLGFAICKDFIKRHQGELSIVSSPNKGTTVSFSLPVAP